MSATSPTLISVLSSSSGCIGFLRTTAKGFAAYTADGAPVGLFESKAAAVTAIRQHRRYT